MVPTLTRRPRSAGNIAAPDSTTSNAATAAATSMPSVADPLVAGRVPRILDSILLGLEPGTHPSRSLVCTTAVLKR